ncbi:MAG: D-alanyl-D-alanine carboxypeptidase/D-alanyl-D-alanine-endopeptidase [Bacteroidota bacterium]|nr:D-alanyl-D-alanine carboxypeptidase/D-alanyl-D-alanine-endopeptidase [Bacteroidota bacterium]
MPCQTGIKIVSLATGEVLYERNANMLFHPASNMKLLTTAAGLNTLGADYEFTTLLLADTSIHDSVEQGNLYFKGYGDPDFNTHELAELISSVKKTGIKEIEGNLIGDVSYFDNQRWGVGWMWDDEPYGYAAYNSPLTINHNCVQVTVHAGYNAGDPPTVIIDPPTAYVSLENSATMNDSGINTLEVSRKYEERLNAITVKGTMPLGAPDDVEEITVLNPELYFLTLAKEELRRQGVELDGTLSVDSIPRTAALLSAHAQPMDSVIVYLNKVSDNLSAENLLKIIGASHYGIPGTSQHGISVVKRILAGFGIDSTKFLMVDGSGVSHYNVLTPAMYIKLLSGMYHEKKLFDLYYASLPIAGVDGTLEDRMRGTPAQNNVHAKTGSISGVSTLSGYVHTADNEPLAFSMMMQNFIGSDAPYHAAQDSIAVAMASFRR